MRCAQHGFMYYYFHKLWDDNHFCSDEKVLVYIINRT